MKRKLTEKEAELTKKGIKNREKRLTENETELQYLNEFDEFNTKWSKYLEDKEKKTKEHKAKMMIMARKQLMDDIKIDKNAIKEDKRQIKEGVEEKVMPGVN